MAKHQLLISLISRSVLDIFAGWIFKMERKLAASYYSHSFFKNNFEFILSD